MGCGPASSGSGDLVQRPACAVGRGGVVREATTRRVENQEAVQSGGGGGGEGGERGGDGDDDGPV